MDEENLDCKHINLSLFAAGLINTTKAVMSSPLPKVYEDCGNGTAQPVATTNGLSGAIGGDFKVDELARVSKETVSFNYATWQTTVTNLSRMPTNACMCSKAFADRAASCLGLIVTVFCSRRACCSLCCT